MPIPSHRGPQELLMTMLVFRYNEIDTIGFDISISNGYIDTYDTAKHHYLEKS